MIQFIKKVAAFRHHYQPVSVVLMGQMRWISNNKKTTFYDVLGVQQTATGAEIKHAFKELSKQLHPDLNPNDPTFHAKFIKLNEAYSVLSRSDSRRNYDLSLQHNIRPTTGLYRHSFDQETFSQRDREEERFWDDSIHKMRDKSKDKDYEDRPYYGIKGVDRLPNSYIVFGIIVFAVVGAIIQFIIIKTMTSKHKRFLDDRDKMIIQQYLAVRNRAHSLEMHAKLLREKVAEAEKTR